MKISLIMPTLGRYEEIELFFKSLKLQEYVDFEVIVVDQNENDYVKNIVEKYIDTLDVKYIKSDKKGLSLNRNIGIEKSKGEIIAFPDDDCEYEPLTLKKVHNFFINNAEYDIYSCGVKDKNTGAKFQFLEENSEINKKNIMITGCSITFFIRKKINFDCKFDELLGVGAKFGSGEETDFISSLIYQGYKGYYFSNDYIYHEVKKIEPTIKRYYTYGLGFGALAKKEVKDRKNKEFIFSIFKQISKSIIGIIILNGKRKYQYNYLKGILEGFIKYSVKEKENV